MNKPELHAEAQSDGARMTARLDWYERREKYVARAKAAHGTPSLARHVALLIIWDQENDKP